MVDAGLPGAPGFLDNSWVTLDPGLITDDDVQHWPFSVPVLDKCASFSSILHQPESLNDMGMFGGVVSKGCSHLALAPCGLPPAKKSLWTAVQTKLDALLFLKGL